MFLFISYTKEESNGLQKKNCQLISTGGFHFFINSI